MIVELNEKNMLTYKFQPGDKVVPNHGNPKRYGIVIEHIDENVKVEIGEETGKRTIYIHESKIKLYDETEDMMKKCLFEDASVLDNTTIYFKNGSYIEAQPASKKNNYKCLQPEGLRLYDQAVGNKEREENKMSGIKNQKVLDLYFTRKRDVLSKEYETKKKELTESDVNYLFIKELKNKFNKYVDEHEIKDIKEISFPELPLAEDTRLKLAEIYKEHCDKVNELNSKKEEIIAMLSGCETYEQEMKILHSYNIVSFNTNYVKMETIETE